VGLPTALRHTEHELVGYRRVWRGSAVSTFLTPILYLVAMGMGLGTLVDRGAGEATLEVSYLAFLGPGLLAATAMQTGVGDAAWPVMAGIEWRKTWHAILATPMGIRDLVLGRLGWISIRLALMAVWYALVLTAFGIAPITRTLLGVPLAILLGLSFSGPMLAFTARSHDGQALTHVFRFGIVPLFLFSGTFFPIERLPDWIEPVSRLIPLWHGVELIRMAVLGWETTWSPWAHAAVLVAFLVAGSALAVRLLERRLKP
jgi:lipooligosaccharide transport system permease protein